MTNWPCHAWLQKKLIWPTSKADIRVGYQLLGTNLGDGILCTVLPNYNIHGCLSAMGNICVKAKKCQECIFMQTVKKLNPWEKTIVDKSAWIKACLWV